MKSKKVLILKKMRRDNREIFPDIEKA